MAWRLSTGLRNKLLGAAAGQGSLKEIFANGQIRIYSGSQPFSGDDAETGSLLCTITLASGAMTSGVGTNGINFGNAVDGVIGKADGEVWSGANSETGTAGWFRIYPNDFDANMGTATGGDKIRLDGRVSTSGAEMRLSNTSLVSGVTTTIDNVAISLPAS